MIYTLTFNPALDYIITPEATSLGTVTRTKAEKLLPGGKGINVSTVLTNLNIPSTAIAFTAGFTGCELEQMLLDMGVLCDFIALKDGMTRINVKIRSNPEREINARGPIIEEEHLKALFEKLECLKKGDFLVLSGNIPSGIDRNIYRTIGEKLSKKGVEIVLDAEGDLLTAALSTKPFLVKPNHHELGAIFGKTLTTKLEIAECAKKLCEMGAKNVFVSLAEDGGILVCENGDVIYSPAPQGSLVNSTGAGDSAVAGFLAGYLETDSLANALMWGLAAGSASAFSENLADLEGFSSLLKSMSEEDLAYL